MKQFLHKIVDSIVSEGTKFEITEEENEGLKVFTILAPQEEVGKLIGKQGKVINAIRTLCRLKSMKDQQRILIKIGEAQA